MLKFKVFCIAIREYWPTWVWKQWWNPQNKREQIIISTTNIKLTINIQKKPNNPKSPSSYCHKLRNTSITKRGQVSYQQIQKRNLHEIFRRDSHAKAKPRKDMIKSEEKYRDSGKRETNHDRERWRERAR